MKVLNGFLTILLAVTAGAFAQSAPPLTVVVVIDQFPLYLIDQNADLFGEGGFKRLEREGVLFSECHYSHAVLETGPGHATLATGCNPKQHGIVANGWQTPDGSDVYCVECDSVHPLGSTGGVADAASSYCPDNLKADGLSDLWRASFGEDAKIWSLSLKDRAAIAMGGKHPTGALWLDSQGGFQSSTYYWHSMIPQWCIDFNLNRYYGDATWVRVAKPEAYYRCDTDDAWYEDGSMVGLSNTLPKHITSGNAIKLKEETRALRATPLGNDLLFDLAHECLLQEQLGKDKTPDLLWVSFSSNDYCGHTFGPTSHEVLDMTVRTDMVISALLTLLDKQVGKGNYWLALTADHGVCPPPESSLMPSGMGGRLNLSKMESELEDHLAQKFMNGISPKDGVISALEIPTVYFNLKAVNELGLDLHALATESAHWLSAQAGVSQAVVTITAQDIAAITDSNLHSHIAESFDPERFAQVYLNPQPYWQSDGICANHGTIHDYDTHVPLFFFGKAFRGDRISAPADPTDLVTTLAGAAGLKWAIPRDGKILANALAK